MFSRGGGRRVKMPSKLRKRRSVIRKIAIPLTSFPFIMCSLAGGLMYVYATNEEIRRKRLLKNFIFYNDYSIINRHSVFANYHSKGLSLRDRVKESVTRQVLNILLEPRVREKGTEFVVDLFQQPKTRDAAVILLKNVIQDKRFIYHSTLWATDLLSRVVLENDVIHSVKFLAENLLKQDSMVEETVDLLKYVTKRPEASAIMSNYYNIVFQRVDVKNAVAELLSEGAYQGLADPKTVVKFAEFIVKVVNNDEVRDGVFDSFIYKPIRNITNKIW